jgi:hypothetical protein
MAHNVRKSIAMWHFLHWNAQLESFTHKTNRKTRKFYFIYFTRKLLLGKSF